MDSEIFNFCKVGQMSMCTAATTENQVDCVFGLGNCLCHYHSLASRQAICLDNHRGTNLFRIGVRSRFFIKNPILGGRYGVLFEEILHENLAAFKNCRILPGPENPQVAFFKEVHYAHGQRGFGAHNREVDVIADGIIRKCRKILNLMARS